MPDTKGAEPKMSIQSDFSAHRNAQNYSRLSTVKSSPKFSFRPKARNETSGASLPGPGHYETKTHNNLKFRNSGSYSFGTGEAQVKPPGTPGPGEYQSPKHGSVGEKFQPQRPPQWRFGSTVRMHSPHAHARETPGPGAYQSPAHGNVGAPVAKNRSPRWGFGSSQRQASASPRELPGPGSYEAPRHGAIGEKKAAPLSAPQWRFGSEEKMKGPPQSVANSPGPGSYERSHGAVSDERKVMPRSPKWKFGSNERFHSPHEHAKRTPGPGAHGNVFTTMGH